MLDPGFTIFFWCLIIFGGLAVFCGLYCMLFKKEPNAFTGPVMIIGGGVSVLLLIIGAFMFFPYDMKYQTWTPTKKMVRSMHYDVEAGGTNKNATGGLKLTFADNTVAYTDDFRLAVVKPGTQAQMLCKPEFIGGNIDKIRCKGLTGG